MTEVRDGIGWRTIDPAPIPPALYDKQDQLALALSGLLMETQRLRIASDDAVNIALSTVAQVLCHGVPSEFDQDLLRLFAADESRTTLENIGFHEPKSKRPAP